MILSGMLMLVWIICFAMLWNESMWSNCVNLVNVLLAALIAMTAEARAGEVHPTTLRIAVSDGFDSDDTASLARELAELRRRARRLLWLNPALALHADAAQKVPGALRREIDALLPAHNLEALSHAIDRMLDA